MDFDIGNLLYVVITLVVVIVGLMGKKKKPAGTGSETGEGTTGGFLENLEKAFNSRQEDQLIVGLQDHEEDLPVEEVEEKPAPVSESKGMWADYKGLHKPSYDSLADSILAEGGGMAEAMDDIDLDEEDGTDYFEVVKEFDAGTAVVYSAIINRLDY
ncbi:MAG: hypothetical protein KAR19_16130 [Bacteroidales bacterium]|nr:hypothetical protein [Bacteroidales bacterium]